MLDDGSTRALHKEEIINPSLLPKNSKIFGVSDMTSQGKAKEDQTFTFKNRKFSPGPNSHWKANFTVGMELLIKK